MKNYILVDGCPVEEPDIMKWCMWMDKGDSTVARDEVNGILISTVFLGTDHRFAGEGSPILWETMIFGGSHDEYQDRYTSLEDALAGHAKALELAQQPAEEQE